MSVVKIPRLNASKVDGAALWRRLCKLVAWSSIKLTSITSKQGVHQHLYFAHSLAPYALNQSTINSPTQPPQPKMATPVDPPVKDAAKEAKEAEQAAHYALLEQLDNHSVHKSFRSTSWKPNQRRNKNIKTILGDAQRRELAATAVASSIAPTPTGAETPNPLQHDDGLSTSGTNTPAGAGAAAASPQQQVNLAQASSSLSKLVLEKNLAAKQPPHQQQIGPAAVVGVTYTNIESAPSLAPQRKYCDITGLKGSYQDPKTRLRYHNAEVFGLIRTLPPGYAEQYLEARGAHTVLK